MDATPELGPSHSVRGKNVGSTSVFGSNQLLPKGMGVLLRKDAPYPFRHQSNVEHFFSSRKLVGFFEYLLDVVVSHEHSLLHPFVNWQWKFRSLFNSLDSTRSVTIGKHNIAMECPFEFHGIYFRPTFIFWLPSVPNSFVATPKNRIIFFKMFEWMNIFMWIRNLKMPIFQTRLHYF